MNSKYFLNTTILRQTWDLQGPNSPILKASFQQWADWKSVGEVTLEKKSALITTIENMEESKQRTCLDNYIYVGQILIIATPWMQIKSLSH